MKKIISFMLMCIIVILLFMFIPKNKVNANSNLLEWSNYSFDDLRLYSETNTYTATEINNGNISYNFDNNVPTEFMPGAPQITILTHGLTSDASVWSNENTENSIFTFTEDSLITRLNNLVGGANIYWCRTGEAEEKEDYIYELYDINKENIDIKNGTINSYVCRSYTPKNLHDETTSNINVTNINDDTSSTDVYRVKDANGNDRITDISKPIIIVFESLNSDTFNDVLYRQFNYVISKVIYDVKILNNNKMPKINLIGHSRGGITNLQYALDHPYIVSSIFSLGTPYLGSTSAELLTTGFLEKKGDGYLDIIEEEKYTAYLNRWNNSYDTIYSNIDVHAIGGYSTFSWVISNIEEYFILENKSNVWDIVTIGLREIERGWREGIKDQATFDYSKLARIVSRILQALELDSSPTAVAKLISKELIYSSQYDDIIFYNDVLVDLNSQLGIRKNYDNNTKIQYRGFKHKTKLFENYNFERDKTAQKDVPVIHNLETRDAELISYILKNIEMVNKTNDLFETYNIGENKVGIRTILKTINTQSLEIPSTINGKTVTEIGLCAFADNVNCNPSITSIRIPDTIEVIRNAAFQRCSVLEGIYFTSNSSLARAENELLLYSDNVTIYNCPDTLTNADLKKVPREFKTTQTVDCRSGYDNDATITATIRRNQTLMLELNVLCCARYEIYIVANSKLQFEVLNSSNEVELKNSIVVSTNSAGKKVYQFTIDFTSGIHVLYTILSGNTESDEIEVTINSLYYGREEITNNDTNIDLTTHMHNGHNSLIFTTTEQEFYMFELAGSNLNSVLDRIIFKIVNYDTDTAVKKIEYIKIGKNHLLDGEYVLDGLFAEMNKTGTIVFLPVPYRTYCIEIYVTDFDEISNLQLRIESIPLNTFAENSNNTFNTDVIAEDKIQKIHFNSTGSYNITIEYECNIQRNIYYGIFVKKENASASEFENENSENNAQDSHRYNYVVLKSGVLGNGVSSVENHTIDILAGTDIYIGYFDANNGGKFKVSINKQIQCQFEILTDRNDNAVVGSEVRLNGGEYGGKSITQGFTRICYLGENAPNLESRLNYEWSSSDANIAIVSPYGTVTAIASWNEDVIKKEVIITATYKNDTTYVGTITLTIYKDTTDFENKVYLNKYGMDVRDGGIVGTEITSGKGMMIPVSVNPVVTIHVGYNRLICLGDDSPNSSLQSFSWSVINSDGTLPPVRVSQYGTITGLSTGTAVIRGIYRYNQRFIIEINITVLN